MLIHNLKAKFFRDKAKLTYNKLELNAFFKKNIEKLENKNIIFNYSKSVNNFKDKFAYNFYQLQNILFCTLTIATNDNSKPVWVTKGGKPFQIQRVSMENASNLEWANHQWKLFIMRLIKKYNLTTDFKWSVVAERQKRGVWHFHFVANKFLPDHKNCPIGKYYHGRTSGCFTCNYRLAQLWKIGYCQKKEVKIKNGNHFASYMAKYMSKSFKILGRSKKAYRFSHSCENIPTSTFRFVSTTITEKRKYKNGIFDVTFADIFICDFFTNCDRYEWKEIEIKSNLPNDCFYGREPCMHKKFDCFYKKVKILIFWFVKADKYNWLSHYFHKLKTLEYLTVFKKEAEKLFKHNWSFDIYTQQIIYEIINNNLI